MQLDEVKVLDEQKITRIEIDRDKEVPWPLCYFDFLTYVQPNSSIFKTELQPELIVKYCAPAILQLTFKIGLRFIISTLIVSSNF